MVFKTDGCTLVVELVVTERNPASFTAPPDMNEFLAVRKQLKKRVDGFGCVGMPFGDELESAGPDPDFGHEDSWLGFQLHDQEPS